MLGGSSTKGVKLGNFGNGLEAVLLGIGNSFLYKEGGLITLVRLTSLNFSDGKLKISLSPVNVYALTGEKMRSFEISCGKDDIAWHRDGFSAPIVGWRLFTQKKFINFIVKFSNNTPGRQVLMDKMRELSVP